MFNKVVLVGNLTRDIELRYTTAGAAIGNSAIAVTRKFNANGEKREETCFIDITFFGKQAEIANQYLSKGSKVLVEGRLKFDQWTDNNGQNRSKHSVSVDAMEMLGGQSQGGNQNNQDSYNHGGNFSGGYNQNSGYNQNNFANNRNNMANNHQNTQKQPVKKQDDYYKDDFQEIDIDADKYESDETIPF